MPSSINVRDVANVVVPALLIVLMVTLHNMPETIDALAYERTLLITEPWRIIGAHFVHLNWLHLLSNSMAFVAVCVLFRHYVAGRILLNVILFSAVLACLLPWVTGFEESFAGLSGVLHGIVAYAGIRMLQAGNRWSYGVLSLLGIKLLYEVTIATGTAGWLGADVAYTAHLGGALGGVISVFTLQNRT